MRRVQEELEEYRRRRAKAANVSREQAVADDTDHKDSAESSHNAAAAHVQPTNILDAFAFDMLNVYPMRKWREFSNTNPLQCWVLTGCIWLSGQLLATKAEFGLVYFLLSAFLIMFLNMGVRREGELSAYSVFNPNLERLPGQLTGEHFERDLMMRGRREDG